METDWEWERGIKRINKQISTDSRTQGTLVLMVSDFWFFYYWIYGTKIEKEKGGL